MSYYPVYLSLYDPCFPNPCNNGGYCLKYERVSTGQTCYCRCGYTGHKCQNGEIL